MLSSTTANDEKIATLVAMGFNMAYARRALQDTAGNLEQAVNALLMGDAGGGVNTTNNEAVVVTSTAAASASISTTTTPTDDWIPTTKSTITTIQGSTSQYTVENGRSACTCMALCAALQFLSPSSPTGTAMGVTTTPDGLDDMVRSGSLIYSSWRKSLDESSCSSSNMTMEHTSPEDALLSGWFPQLALRPGGIVQGLAEHRHHASPTSHHNPLGWYSLLSQCQQSASSSSSSSSTTTFDTMDTDWICVVITKPPETVLVCLPPLSLSSNNNNNNHGDTSPLLPSTTTNTNQMSDSNMVVDDVSPADTTDTPTNQTVVDDVGPVDIPTNQTVVDDVSPANTNDTLTNQTSGSDTVVDVDSNGTSASVDSPADTPPPPRRHLYILIDSHPRPTQFQTHHAYCRSHESLLELVDSLQILFPAINLNDGNNANTTSDLMAAMYNSFDLYPLTLMPSSPSQASDTDKNE